MSQATVDQKKKQKKFRQSYLKPQLQVYGALKDLTASGSAGVSEAGAQAKTKQFP